MKDIGTKTRAPEGPTGLSVVVVTRHYHGVDELEWYKTFGTPAEASAYKECTEDMMEFFGKDRDYSAYCLDWLGDREEWENAGSPGFDLFGHRLLNEDV